MIHCVTFNPSVDLSLTLPQLKPGNVHYLEGTLEDPGGKGMNVARALHELEIPALSWVFLGGTQGERWIRLASRTGVEIRVTPIEGETRQNIKIFEEHSRVQTDLNSTGPLFDENAGAMFFDHLDKEFGDGDLLVVAGKPLHHTPSRFWMSLSLWLRKRNARCAIDMTGEGLNVLADKVWLVKINLDEWNQWRKRSDRSLKEVLDDPGLAQMNANLIITHGPNGAIAVLKNGRCLMVLPPSVETKGTVGAGDSFLAGLLGSLSQSPDDWTQALQWACATSGAALELPGTSFGSLTRVKELIPEVLVHEIKPSTRE